MIFKKLLDTLTPTWYSNKKYHVGGVPCKRVLKKNVDNVKRFSLLQELDNNIVHQNVGQRHLLEDKNLVGDEAPNKNINVHNVGKYLCLLIGGKSSVQKNADLHILMRKDLQLRKISEFARYAVKNLLQCKNVVLDENTVPQNAGIERHICGTKPFLTKKDLHIGQKRTWMVTGGQLYKETILHANTVTKKCLSLNGQKQKDLSSIIWMDQGKLRIKTITEAISLRYVNNAIVCSIESILCKLMEYIWSQARFLIHWGWIQCQSSITISNNRLNHNLTPSLACEGYRQGSQGGFKWESGIIEM